MLILSYFNTFKPEEIMGMGIVSNSPEGVYMTDYRLGDDLLWVAVKGWADDWAIYCHWSEHDIDYVKNSGDKITSMENVKKCIKCDEEVLNRYRL